MKRKLVVSLILSLVLVFAMGMSIQASTVKIGLSAPITGNYAEYGENFQYSVQLAADQLNEQGGIDGRQIEIIVRDSEGDPSRAAAIAQEFVNNQEIVAEIGDFTSTACLAAAPIYEARELVQLSPTSSHPDFAVSGDYMFGIVGTQAAEGPFNVEEIAQNYLDIDSVAVVYINNDWGVATKDYFVEAAEEKGLKITGEESFMANETDFSALLTNLERENPEGIYIAAMYNEASQIVRDIERMNMDVKLLAPSSVFSTEFIELAGSAGEGMTTNTFFSLIDETPEVQDFISEFESRAGRKPNLHAAVAYDSMMLLADAIERAGFDRTDIRDALAETEGFIGVTGEIEFTEKGDVERSYMILKVVDGEWEVVKDLRM